MNVKERAQGASLGRRIDYNASQDAEKRERLNKIIRANADSKIDELEQAPTTAEVEAMYERDKRASDLLNIREDAMRGDAIRESVEDYRARLNAEKPESILIDELIDERNAEKRLDYDPALEKTTTEFKGSPITPYKTYSEKEAERLSNKDRDKLRAGTLDEIAFDRKGRALGERGGLLRFADRLLDPKQAKEDEQHYQEFLRKQKEALAREHARTGGPFGSGMRKGRYYDPYESPLLKRMKAKRKAQALGSILHS